MKKTKQHVFDPQRALQTMNEVVENFCHADTGDIYYRKTLYRTQVSKLFKTHILRLEDYRFFTNLLDKFYATDKEGYVDWDKMLGAEKQFIKRFHVVEKRLAA